MKFRLVWLVRVEQCVFQYLKECTKCISKDILRPGWVVCFYVWVALSLILAFHNLILLDGRHSKEETFDTTPNGVIIIIIISVVSMILALYHPT